MMCFVMVIPLCEINRFVWMLSRFMIIVTTDQLAYRQSAWNDVQCYDKCLKASCVKHCMCALPGHTKDSVFLLAQMTLCLITLCNFPPFLGPNTISDGPTDELSILQFMRVIHKVPGLGL